MAADPSLRPGAFYTDLIWTLCALLLATCQIYSSVVNQCLVWTPSLCIESLATYYRFSGSPLFESLVELGHSLYLCCCLLCFHLVPFCQNYWPQDGESQGPLQAELPCRPTGHASFLEWFVVLTASESIQTNCCGSPIKLREVLSSQYLARRASFLWFSIGSCQLSGLHWKTANCQAEVLRHRCQRTTFLQTIAIFHESSKSPPPPGKTPAFNRLFSLESKFSYLSF